MLYRNWTIRPDVRGCGFAPFGWVATLWWHRVTSALTYKTQAEALSEAMAWVDERKRMGEVRS